MPAGGVKTLEELLEEKRKLKGQQNASQTSHDPSESREEPPTSQDSPSHTNPESGERTTESVQNDIKEDSQPSEAAQDNDFVSKRLKIDSEVAARLSPLILPSNRFTT